MLATLLDESSGKTGLLNRPEKARATATLNLSHRAPTLCHHQDIRRQARKLQVSGRIGDIEGMVLVEAQALFVQPWYTKLLSSQRLHRHIGRPILVNQPSWALSRRCLHLRLLCLRCHRQMDEWACMATVRSYARVWVNE
ncbi:hypothetical protein BC629DRAFT_1614492, partial [Irpex lacteus]